MVLLLAAVGVAAVAVRHATLVYGPYLPKREGDHRKEPRGKRVKYNHDRALACIKEDYLEPNLPLAKLKMFSLQFRLSRDRFECIMADVANSGCPFYHDSNVKVASLEARLLLPIKVLAYGVPPHAFCDYFQMSPQFARNCCFQFDKIMKMLYAADYLRLPDEEDLKNIVKLHKNVHKVDGMFGSLDCTHTYWKNCPKGHAGSYYGKEKKPTIVMEAACDYHMWFWHICYGYAGSLNDLTILDGSPLLQSFITGAFEAKEEKAGVVPYTIGEQDFNKLFILVDGIYPKYSRFVKGYSQPIFKTEKNYTKWQEGARKDIERAFGVLKQTWQFMDRPMRMLHLDSITNRVGTCIILHNMLVQDRVMGAPKVGGQKMRYNPALKVRSNNLKVYQPTDMENVLQQHNINSQAGAGGNVAIEEYFKSNIDRWKDLDNRVEHTRLHIALLEKFGSGEAAFS